MWELLGKLAKYLWYLWDLWDLFIKKIEFKGSQLLYSDSLYQMMFSKELYSGYGRAELNIDFSNPASIPKQINIGELEYRVSGYQEIEFEHMVLDYILVDKSNRPIAGINFTPITFFLYAINNGNCISSKCCEIRFLGDSDLLDEQNIQFELQPGEVRNIYKFELNSESLVKLFRQNKYSRLYIVLSFENNSKKVSIQFINGRFDFYIGSRGAVSPMNGNIIDLIVDKNFTAHNDKSIDFEPHSSKTITFKMFPLVSSEFTLELSYKKKKLCEKQIKVFVPQYCISSLKCKILECDFAAIFMSKNGLTNYLLTDYVDNKDELCQYKSELFLTHQIDE